MNIEQSIAIKIMKKRANPIEEDKDEKIDEQRRALVSIGNDSWDKTYWY